MALAQVVFDAVVTAQDHGGHQTQQFLCADVKRPGLVGLVIQAPKSFDYQVVLRQDPVVHSGAELIKFLYWIHRIYDLILWQT